MDKVRRPVLKNSLSTTLSSSRSKEFLSLLGGCEEHDHQMQAVQASCNSGYRYSRLYLRAVAVLAVSKWHLTILTLVHWSATQSERLTRHAMACHSKVLNLIGCQWDPSFTQGLADGTDC